MKNPNFYKTRNLFLIVLLTVCIVFFLNKRFFLENNSQKLDELIETVDIKESEIIGKVDTKEKLFIFVENKNDLNVFPFKKKATKNSVTYEKEDMATTTNFFTDKNQLLNIKIFTEILDSIQKKPEFIQKDNKVKFFTTTNKQETYLKINGQAADQIVTHTKNNQTFYILVFDNIDYTQQIEVTL